MNKKVEDIACSVIRVANKHKKICESKMNNENIDIHPAQHRILMVLSSNGKLNQKDLASFLQVSPATITISIKKLVKDGYISKESMESDNRYNLLQITEKGREVITKSNEIFTSIENMMFSDFSEQEKNLFWSMLERIAKNLDE